MKSIVNRLTCSQILLTATYSKKSDVSEAVRLKRGQKFGSIFLLQYALGSWEKKIIIIQALVFDTSDD